MNPYVYLAAAIVLEVMATSLLKASDGMSRLWPTVGALAGYGLCFYLLSVTMKSVPTGVAYAIWSGVGIVLISLIGLVVFKQRLDAPALAGIALICAGVLVINLFSRSSAH
ncbi:SMR family transporter [Stenotrophomonas pavanii]|jgi:small multidrug resistance pump|uniref:Multidrug transporter n=1 Tax=Stenotrophomonas pavanii TaxID=487698 RepID=A0ABN6GW50_9GAMM|nr:MULTISPECIES: SMR family transporter [Stenotrophomonas]MBC9078691.1 QacE family quaternary ammonium compound efflux SMR transporter [Stenotrophomonas maltophilia]TGR44981.1 QacE family quaternary ammonium compound efflux SMR transporter [bacterium M00.F.Ca.ET.199.01.1.1]TGT03757.1 QacE family quaternary ammonium compound efflux SMR transporter [bacterium M00.F.Ca.ET.177.01.1.1]TGT58276.1 QacE family quaternary ammonium compound efflux SMR transporter [Mesorhizobium sp. M00.F.Ca.ET.170.01.1.1